MYFMVFHYFIAPFFSYIMQNNKKHDALIEHRALKIKN